MIDEQSRLAPYLLPGEQIRWTGAPPLGPRFSPADLFIVPFTFLWFAVVLGAGLLGLNSGLPGDDVGFYLMLPLFLLIGFYMSIGRLIHDALIRKHQIYAITNRRVIVFRGWPRANLKSLDISRLPALELSEGRKGRGTIAFEQSKWPWGWGFGGWLPSLDPAIRFLNIADVRQIYAMIQQER